jgi:hypothetical protein
MATIDVLKVGNTITISSAYAQGLGLVNRLGAAQIQFTTPTIQLVDDIFFKFYSCDDSTGTKVYTPIDIMGVSNIAMERFLTMVFLNYYNNSTIVNFLSTVGNSFTPLAQRLADVVVPDTSLSSTLTMPANTSNFVEFVGMGMGSYFGAKYLNDGASDFFTPGPLWGTRVGQVHITTTDPLGPTPIEALYDNSDSGCWQFSDFNTNGLIVYTNLTSGAFSPPRGFGHWGQILCVWPLVAELLNAQFACVFNNLDQSFMKSGLAYFDRSSRRDSYFGWAGNYIQSIFNDWGIPVVSPLWSLSDLSIAAVITNALNSNKGSLSAQTINYRFVGPRASNNISSVVEKSARSLLPLLWANECQYGVGSGDSAYPLFETTVQSLGFTDGADYISDCLTSVSLGYNAHLYRYMLQDVSSGNVTPTSTRAAITNGVSWSASLASQPTLFGVFVDFGRAKYYPNAISDFYTGGYGTALQQRTEFGLGGLTNFPMGATDITNLQAWVYTP